MCFQTQNVNQVVDVNDGLLQQSKQVSKNKDHQIIFDNAPRMTKIQQVEQKIWSVKWSWVMSWWGWLKWRQCVVSWWKLEELHNTAVRSSLLLCNCEIVCLVYAKTPYSCVAAVGNVGKDKFHWMSMNSNNKKISEGCISKTAYATTL